MKGRILIVVAACIAIAFYISHVADRKDNKEDMLLASAAFAHNQPIPIKYTCNGENISPPLVISSAPSDTKSLTLIVDDPDAPVRVWTHWLVYNIPPEIREVAEDSLPDSALSGTNDFGTMSYSGPCPPGGTHRYFFKFYALDKTLTFSTSPSKTDIERAMEGHILTQTELIGTYSRQP